MTGTTYASDPRVAAVREHFAEWHGAIPEQAEITALLLAIDAKDPVRHPETPEDIQKAVYPAERRWWSGGIKPVI